MPFQRSNLTVRVFLLDQKSIGHATVVSSRHCGEFWITSGDRRAFEPATRLLSVCPIRLSMAGSTPTMVITGSGESGFDSGEGA